MAAAVLVASGVGVPAFAAAPAAEPALASMPVAVLMVGGDPQCTGDRYLRTADDADDAADLMRGRLTLNGFGVWTLPSDPTWDENPFGNDVWAVNYQALRWLDPLRREGLRTKNQAMLDRYAALFSDWVADNGYTAARRSPFAWYDMIVAVRAVGLVCAADALGDPAWVTAAMREHGVALLDPDQRGRGNHALHQDMGLLALGCRLGNTDWRDIAAARSTALLPSLVNAEGVAQEGSLQYHALNRRWLLTLQSRMLACGVVPDPTVFARVALMPDLITYATQPDGTLVSWGDTAALARTPQTPGILPEHVLTEGAKGEPPDRTFALFPESGYAFSRSAWFDEQDADEQSLVAVRFGPPMSKLIHGHEDAGAVSFFAAGEQILWQPGLFAYGAGAARTYVRSNEAHNTVEIAGAEYLRDVGSKLIATDSTDAYDLITIRTRALRGAIWERTVVHFKGLNVMLVDDRVRQNHAREVSQHWQLGSDRTVGVGRMRALTYGPGADATLLWAGSEPELTIHQGQKDPLLGWRSERLNEFTPAPTLRASRTGTEVRLTALVLPRIGSETASVLRWSTAQGFRVVDLQIAGAAYRLTFNAGRAAIDPLDEAADVELGLPIRRPAVGEGGESAQ